jgi:desulfoferrodoxin (superoxide reductase-like protein)
LVGVLAMEFDAPNPSQGVHFIPWIILILKKGLRISDLERYNRNSIPSE